MRRRERNSSASSGVPNQKMRFATAKSSSSPLRRPLLCRRFGVVARHRAAFRHHPGQVLHHAALLHHLAAHLFEHRAVLGHHRLHFRGISFVLHRSHVLHHLGHIVGHLLILSHHHVYHHHRPAPHHSGPRCSGLGLSWSLGLGLRGLILRMVFYVLSGSSNAEDRDNS